MLLKISVGIVKFFNKIFNKKKELYTIEKGKHYCKESKIIGVSGTEMEFIVRFNDSAKYISIDPINQYDINKLWGFREGFTEKDSARIGWNWIKDQLYLYSYVHAKGDNYGDDSVAGFPVELNKDIYCSIKVVPDKYIFNIDGNIVEHYRSLSTNKFYGFQLFPYFGGNETAPHTITISIK